MGILNELFEESRTVGLVGSRSTGKSLLVLSELLEIKKTNPNYSIYVMGAEKNLQNYLVKQGIKIIVDKNDILDLKLRDSIIFIDEFSDIFSTRSRTKELDKIERLFNRLSHLNSYIVFGSASYNFWNKGMVGLVKAFLSKKIEFNELTNGTDLKVRIMGLETTSDYRLDIDKNEFYALGLGMTKKLTFKYNPKLDSKKDNIVLFSKKSSEENSTKVSEECSEGVAKRMEELSYVQ